jgi:hypothetical protein
MKREGSCNHGSGPACKLVCAEHMDPIPEQFEHFRAVLEYSRVEEANGFPTAQDEHNQAGGFIVLAPEKTLDGTQLLLSGVRQRSLHPKRNVLIGGTDQSIGYDFRVVCYNRHPKFRDALLFSSFVSAKDMTEILKKRDTDGIISIAGCCMSIASEHSMTLSLGLIQSDTKNQYSIEDVSLVLEPRVYAEFVDWRRY